MKELYPIDDDKCYVRANQKLNIYEHQKEELRQIVRNDPNNFYTYSADYMSLSIDPYVPEDLKQKEDILKKTVISCTLYVINHVNQLWKTPLGFQAILKKSKEDYNKHPKKPHSSTIEERKLITWDEGHKIVTKYINTFHYLFKQALAVSKEAREKPLPVGQKDFNSKIHCTGNFSEPGVMVGEKITGK